MKTKICIKCGIKQGLEAFHKDKKSKDGKVSHCKQCAAKKHAKYYKQNKKKIKEGARVWYKNNIEKARKRNREYNRKHYHRDYWKHHLKKHYNITPDGYNELFNKQCGCCAICKTHQSEIDRRLCVDHDHETGRVRGLLCYSCNTILGVARDNSDLLLSAVEYLED